ncbi:hypothetical protein BT63DRAFT_110839 [Microthyrium microscopicum]|uniref:Uncharacterized protein n=1 Tax=Microthyrium microscopicum TaxID=703497 RepID=A0A6A6TUI4_9PEZI|nr:hypothetical protein BT63DRAFT_110839 [Microthyrium microscopicum]
MIVPNIFACSAPIPTAASLNNAPSVRVMDPRPSGTNLYRTVQTSRPIAGSPGATGTIIEPRSSKVIYYIKTTTVHLSFIFVRIGLAQLSGMGEANVPQRKQKQQQAVRMPALDRGPQIIGCNAANNQSSCCLTFLLARTVLHACQQESSKGASA